MQYISLATKCPHFPSLPTKLRWVGRKAFNQITNFQFRCVIGYSPGMAIMGMAARRRFRRNPPSPSPFVFDVFGRRSSVYRVEEYLCVAECDWVLRWLRSGCTCPHHTPPEWGRCVVQSWRRGMKTCRISLVLTQVGPNWLDPRLALRSVSISYSYFLLIVLFSRFKKNVCDKVFCLGLRMSFKRRCYLRDFMATR